MQINVHAFNEKLNVCIHTSDKQNDHVSQSTQLLKMFLNTIVINNHPSYYKTHILRTQGTRLVRTKTIFGLMGTGDGAYAVRFAFGLGLGCWG